MNGLHRDLLELRQMLVSCFALNELEDLCFELNIQFDNLPGQILSDKARELVAYCHRRGMLMILLEHCRRVRPEFDWPDIEITRSLQENEDQGIYQLYQLRVNLRERRDVERLGNAVYKAEALYVEGKLPDELLEMLSEAREAYNMIRVDAGIVLTMMRFGDLEARKIARDRIEKYVLDNNVPYIFDSLTNRWRPTFEFLAEASKYYQDTSRETAQYEIDRARGALPDHPFHAAARLRDALSRPFFEEDKRWFQRQLEEIEKIVAQRVALFINSQLTLQEIEIVRLLVQKNQTSQQIASELNTSKTSVDIQIRKVCQKLQSFFGLESVDSLTLPTYLASYWEDTA